jgi:hypothetical protein
MVPEPETTGVTFPWERQAMNGDELPDGLDYADKALYLELRSLYFQVRNKFITRETAITEKKKLLDDHRLNKFNEKVGEVWVESIKATEIARADYRKDRTLENADKLLAAIEGVKYAHIVP